MTSRGELRARARRARNKAAPMVPSFTIQSTLWFKMRERAQALGVSTTVYLKALVLQDTGLDPDILQRNPDEIRAAIRGN